MPPLQRPLYDASTESNKMEIELRHMVSEYREGEGLSTAFDDQCSYMLSMALSAYEMERITGQSYSFKVKQTNLILLKMVIRSSDLGVVLP